MAAHLPLQGYSALDFTNAHGQNGQLMKPMLLTPPPPPPPPVGHSHSAPVTDGKGRAPIVSRESEAAEGPPPPPLPADGQGSTSSGVWRL